MTVEALWTVEYQSRSGWIMGGIVVLETNRIFGGDGQYYYTGTYSLNDSNIEGTMTAKHYHGEKKTAWGDAESQFEVKFKGVVDKQSIFGEASRSQGKVPFRMLKRENLP
ncbi:MAG: hypothetical protein HQL51_13735 [Magnetococcales bacterium]|nr:hypothetical protein [Magnetococcales bacterium]